MGGYFNRIKLFYSVISQSNRSSQIGEAGVAYQEPQSAQMHQPQSVQRAAVVPQYSYLSFLCPDFTVALSFSAMLLQAAQFGRGVPRDDMPAVMRYPSPQTPSTLWFVTAQRSDVDQSSVENPDRMNNN